MHLWPGRSCLTPPSPSMSSDHDSGYDASRRGSILGPNSAEGTAGWLAGAARANNRSSGSVEWLVALSLLAPFVAIFYPVATAAALAVAFSAEAIANAAGLGTSMLRWALILVPTVAVIWIVGRHVSQWGLKSRPCPTVREREADVVVAAAEGFSRLLLHVETPGSGVSGAGADPDAGAEGRSRARRRGIGGPAPPRFRRRCAVGRRSTRFGLGAEPSTWQGAGAGAASSCG